MGGTDNASILILEPFYVLGWGLTEIVFRLRNSNTKEKGVYLFHQTPRPKTRISRWTDSTDILYRIIVLVREILKIIESIYSNFQLNVLMARGRLLIIYGCVALLIGGILSTLLYYQILKW